MATKLLANGEVAEADKTLQQAIAKTTAKDEAHYNYGRLIFQGVTTAAIADKAKAQGWTLDKAMNEANEAYKLNPAPVYKHLQAQIVYTKGNYQQAYTDFEALTNTPIKNPELYLEMAQCQEKLNASNEDCSCIAEPMC